MCRSREQRGSDAWTRWGKVLVVAMLASLIYAIIEGPNHGWTSVTTIGLFVVSVAALVGLLVWEPRRREPLIELGFFRSVPFTGATAIAVCAFASMAGFLFMNTLYLQEVRGYSALHAGLLTLPMAGMAMLFGPVSGRVVGTRGPRIPLLIGGVGIGLCGLLLTQLSPTTSVAHLVLAYLVFGIGIGFINTPITNTAVSGMPADQAGVAAAVASTSRMVGQSLGVAVIGAASTVAAGTTLAAGFASATHAGWWIVVGCASMIIVLGFVTTGAWARETATRATARFEAAPT